MNTLITGASRGLGKTLHQYFQGDRLVRGEEIPDKEYDIIVHCAVNSGKEITSENISQYVDDNVLLTNRLLSVKCSKFIFMSTIDIYPKASTSSCSEIDEIEWDVHVPQLGIYTMTKLISEALVKKSDNWMIFRCSTLLGEYSRKHTVMKIIEQKNPSVFVSDQSEYNCILATDVAKFIELSWRKNLQGIYNLSSNDNVKVGDISKLLNKDVTFGNYFYTPGNVNNKKVSGITDIFDKSTYQCIAQFAEEIKT